MLQKFKIRNQTFCLDPSQIVSMVEKHNNVYIHLKNDIVLTIEFTDVDEVYKLLNLYTVNDMETR